MASSTQLFQLIHSLSQSEKRHFKIFSSFQSGNKLYIRLFDAIARQKEYDEKKLKKKLKISAFAVAKTYLNGLILKSLRSRQLNQNVSLQLKDMLKDIEILFQKGLYEQSRKSLLKAKKLAQTYEKFPILMEIYQLEHLITNITNDPVELKRLFEDGHKGANHTIEKYREQMEHRKIINLLSYKRNVLGKLIRNKTDQRKIYSQAKGLLLKNPKTLLSYKTGTFHHNIKELYYYSIQDIENAYQNSKSSIAYMESNPTLLSQELNNYAIALNNLMDAQLLLHRYEDIKSGIDKLRSVEIKATNLTEKARAFGFRVSKEIIYFTRMNRYKEGLALIPSIEKQLSAYGNKVNKPAYYAIYVNIEELHFICGNFKQALHWNNKILNDPQIEFFSDYYSNARISEIIIHYELDNIEKVQSLIQSYYLFLTKNKAKNKYEKSLIRFFKNCINIANQRELKEEFVRFHNELLKLAEDPYEKEVFDFFDLISWLRSKIDNRPFEKVMREKTKR